MAGTKRGETGFLIHGAKPAFRTANPLQPSGCFDRKTLSQVPLNLCCATVPQASTVLTRTWNISISPPVPTFASTPVPVTSMSLFVILYASSRLVFWGRWLSCRITLQQHNTTMRLCSKAETLLYKNIVHSGTARRPEKGSSTSEKGGTQ